MLYAFFWVITQKKAYNIIEFFAAEKIPLLNIHCCMQPTYGDKSVDVSTVRRWVQKFQQEEVGEANLYNKVRIGGQ